MKYWLLKSEPDVWSVDQQKSAGSKGAPWDGVRNYQAAKNLRNMKKGATDDLIDDNPTLIDEYGSIDFMNTVRNQVIKWVRG